MSAGAGGAAGAARLVKRLAVGNPHGSVDLLLQRRSVPTHTTHH